MRRRAISLQICCDRILAPHTVRIVLAPARTRVEVLPDRSERHGAAELTGGERCCKLVPVRAWEKFGDVAQADLVLVQVDEACDRKGSDGGVAAVVELHLDLSHPLGDRLEARAA